MKTLAVLVVLAAAALEEARPTPSLIELGPRQFDLPLVGVVVR